MVLWSRDLRVVCFFLVGKGGEQTRKGMRSTAVTLYIFSAVITQAIISESLAVNACAASDTSQTRDTAQADTADRAKNTKAAVRRTRRREDRAFVLVALTDVLDAQAHGGMDGKFR